MKEFLLLIREAADYGSHSLEDLQADIQLHVKWVESLVQQGFFKDGNPLEANGAVLSGHHVTDGPYIETKECISGYYFLLAPSLEKAVEIARGCPDLARGASLEVREIIQMPEDA